MSLYDRCPEQCLAGHQHYINVNYYYFLLSSHPVAFGEMLPVTPGMFSNWKCLVGKRSLPGSRHYLAKELAQSFSTIPCPLRGQRETSNQGRD